MNSSMTAPGNLVPVVVANAVLVLLLFALETSWGFHFEIKRTFPPRAGTPEPWPSSATFSLARDSRPE